MKCFFGRGRNIGDDYAKTTTLKKEEYAMKYAPLIPIERASESTITMLIDMGILYTDENGIHVAEHEENQ